MPTPHTRTALFRYFRAVLKSEHHPTIVVHRSPIQNSNPEPLTPLRDDLRLFFQRFHKRTDFLASALALCKLGFQPLMGFQSRTVSLLNPLRLLGVILLRLCNSTRR